MSAQATAAQVLAAIAAHDAAMHTLDSPSVAVIEHVSLTNRDGADTRIDACPCHRGLETLDGDPVQLGEGRYISSGRHTLGDLVRDVVGDDEA